MAEALTEDDVFSNDIDPLEGIRQLRKEEGEDTSSIDELQENSDEPADEVEDDSQDTDDFDDADDTEQSDDIVDETTDDASEESADVETTEEVAAFDPDKKLTFKADGQDFEFTQQEMLDQFGTIFGKSVGFTNKTKRLAPFRRRIEAMEKENVTDEQFNLAIDALKGNKQAIKQLMDNHSIESYDLTEEAEGDSKYTPTEYGSDDATLDLQEVVNGMMADTEYAVTSDVVQNRWDTQSQDMLANNPTYLQGLHNDVKSGVYARVAAEATKLKVFDGNTKSDIEYYMLAGQNLGKQPSTDTSEVDKLNAETQDAVNKSDRASSEATKRRSAASSRNRADRTVVDYLDDDNDEAYDEWYKKTIASQ